MLEVSTDGDKVKLCLQCQLRAGEAPVNVCMWLDVHASDSLVQRMVRAKAEILMQAEDVRTGR